MTASTKSYQYILGVDLGIASIGTALIRLDKAGNPAGILDAGVRIFEIANGAGECRVARQSRTVIAHRRERLHALRTYLQEHNLLPRDKDALAALMCRSPYRLRAFGVQNPFRNVYDLSHVAVCAIPDMSSPSFLGTPVTCQSANARRLVCVTDCAMNISPNLQRKLEIVRNAVGVVRGLDIGTPCVAMLAATEKVMLPAMPATLDAQLIARMAAQGEFGDNVLVAGPMALDVAVSAGVAERKGLVDPVAGRANILCAPDIESGNVLYKALTTLLCTEMAGVLVGTTAPVVMSSRGDSQRTKLLSIALAAHLASV